MGGKMKNHKDLNAWKKSIDLVTRIYQVTQVFPGEELYGLTSQIRRAAVSIPSNIAEGAARQSRKEFLHFLHISLGSLSEVETQLVIARNLEYVNDPGTLLGEIEVIRKLINGLIFSLKGST